MTLRRIDVCGETPRSAPAGERCGLDLRVWPLCDVAAALRDGLGVEDIAARGVCSVGYARELVALFRAQGCLPRVLGIGGER